jgi:murein DD-endopeptidase MepM/ murein hydrolase activator NlpD
MITQPRTLGLFALLVGLASAGCGSDADKKVRIEEPLRIEASAATQKSLGVAVWGAMKDGNVTRIRGYTATGKPTVAFTRQVAYGEGTYQVLMKMEGKTDAKMTIEVGANTDDVVVANDHLGTNSVARSVIERLASDVKKQEGARTPSLTQSLRTVSEDLSGEGEKLTECTDKLLATVTSLVDAIKSGGSDLTAEATKAAEEAKGVADGCKGQGGGQQGAQQGQGGGQQGGQGQGGQGASGGMPGMDQMSSMTGAMKCLPQMAQFWLPILSKVGSAVVSMSANGNLSHNTADSKDGIDFDLPEGSELTAMADGVVVMANNALKKGMPCYDGGGPECKDKMNYVVIRHDGEVDSLYAHLATATVKVGAKVARGDIIGTVGSTGESTGPHAHVQLQKICGKVQCETLPLSFGEQEQDKDKKDDGAPEAGEKMMKCLEESAASK